MVPAQQKALFLESKQGQMAVRTTEVPQPKAGEVLARVDAAALNPMDWKIQAFGLFVEQYPSLLGIDGAGVVVAIGEGVTFFAVGDRIAWQSTMDFVGKKIDQGTFVQYATLPITNAVKIPANVSLEAAASLPCTLPSAAFPLYNQSDVGLTAPWAPGGKGKYSNKSALVIGGSSSVGQYTIQFLRLSGFSTIVTVASPRHEAHLKSLGATHVVDRSLPSDSLQTSATAPLSGGLFDLVYDAICAPETVKLGYALTAPSGDFVYVSPLVTVPTSTEDGSRKRTHAVFGTFTRAENDEARKGLLEALPGLLETGEIQLNRIEVIPGGLNGVSEGLNRLKMGKVSGTKLVVLPQETA